MTNLKLITRRGFIKIGGSALAALACAPLPDLIAGTRDLLPALVAAAVQAANPHNSQPWLFKAASERLDLFADHTRAAGSVDPYGRELFLGLGCALENLMLAAAAHGYAGRLALLPDPENPSHAARVDLAAAPLNRPELFTAIPLRRTNRGPYQGKPVPRALLEALEALNQEAFQRYSGSLWRGLKRQAGLIEQAERAVRG
jgi:nitroreductase